jgi:hypothetical protein
MVVEQVAATGPLPQIPVIPESVEPAHVIPESAERAHVIPESAERLSGTGADSGFVALSFCHMPGCCCFSSRRS